MAVRDDLPRDPIAEETGWEELEGSERRTALFKKLVDCSAGTQEELADALGVSYATVHAWKTGRRDVPMSAVASVARVALARSRVLLTVGTELLALVEGAGRSGGGAAPTPTEPSSPRLTEAEEEARSRRLRESLRRNRR